jgi:hypothetical protein
LTLVFTGYSSGAAPLTHVLQGSGSVDISSPTSGTWSGVAVYQDPRLPTSTNLNYSAAGNSPTLNISGLFYAPNSDMTLSGTVTFSSSGSKCLAFIVNTFLVNGSPNVTDGTADCKSKQGLNGLPQVNNLVNLVG